MTLNTVIRVGGDASHREVFDIALLAIMKAAGREDEAPQAFIEFSEAGQGSHNTIVYAGEEVVETKSYNWTNENVRWGSVIGQGLPGIVWVELYDTYYEVSYDTGYGYRDGGLNCTELHVSAMLWLEELLPEGTVIVEWMNEYTGEWNKTVDGSIGPGVVEFLRGGDNALEWFTEVSSLIMQGVNPAAHDNPSEKE